MTDVVNEIAKVENGLNSRENERVKEDIVEDRKVEKNISEEEDKHEHVKKVLQEDELPESHSNDKREFTLEEETERNDNRTALVTKVATVDCGKNSCENEKNSLHEQTNDNTCFGCQRVVTEKQKCNICLEYKMEIYFCSEQCYSKYYKYHQILHAILEHSKTDLYPKEGEDYDIQETDFSQRITKEMILNIIKKKLNPKNYDPEKRIFWMYDDHLKQFANFEFTGKIRPWPITKMRTVASHIQKPDYADTSVPESELSIKNKRDIYVNTEEDIKKIRAVSVLARKALDYAHTLVKEGVTPEEIDEQVHDFIIKNNAYPSTLNYFKFPKSCCTSVNEVVCHGIPDTRPLEKGDIINIDITVFSNGFHSDLNETFFVGDLDDISKEAKDLVETCYFSLMEAVKHCKPGMLYKNIGNVITSFVSKKKYSVVRTYSGHGVGKCFHSNPTIPHYKKNKAVGIMQPGHVFTIEPMINQGTYDDLLWPDGWTSVTADGKLSAQFEHTLLITKCGVEVLTKRLPTSPSLGFDTKDHLYYG